jgi:hypothetical protein
MSGDGERDHGSSIALGNGVLGVFLLPFMLRNSLKTNSDPYFWKRYNPFSSVILQWSCNPNPFDTWVPILYNFNYHLEHKCKSVEKGFLI